MSDLGEKPRRGKPGAQSGETYAWEDRLGNNLRPEEDSVSALNRSVRNFADQAKNWIPGVGSGVESYRAIRDGDSVRGGLKALQAGAELGLLATGVGAARDVRDLGSSLTPKVDSWLSTVGLGSSGPGPAMFGVAPSHGVRNAADIERTLEQLRKASAADNTAFAAKSGPYAPTSDNKFMGVFERAPAPPPPREMPGGYVEVPMGRRGMDMDAAGILNGWRVPKDALPNAAGGAVRGGYADGGIVSGALKSEYGQGGRTDDLPVNVGSGSFVIPADCVSALGQGSSDAGHKILQRMFPVSPAAPQMAAGGSVPIIAAVDEHILSPEQVAAVGEGDVDLGHRILDQFVLDVRKNHIKTLKGLPAPAR